MLLRRKKQNVFPPIAGKLKVGEKVPTKNGGQRPKGLDYFIVKFDQPIFQNTIGNAFNDAKLSSIPIRFLTNEQSFNIINRLEIRDSAGKLYAYTDLEKIFVANTELKGDAYLDVTEKVLKKYNSIEEALPDVCAKVSTEKYSAEARECLILRFAFANTGTDMQACLELRTHASKSSIEGIVAAYQQAEKESDIKECIFVLSVKMHTSNRSGVASTYPVISMLPIYQNSNNSTAQLSQPIIKLLQ
jgi:hypothetical protein